MIPIVSIVGKSDSGKTTLLEKLTAELTQRGYKVASVKHDAHDFEIDKEGKDSWRHKKAGATTTIISSPHKVAALSNTDRDLRLSELRDRFVLEEDIILSEGYYRDTQPKIEVSQKERPYKLLCSNDKSLIAVASKYPMKLAVPWFHLDDIKSIVDFIECRFLNKNLTMKKNACLNKRAMTGIILSGGKNIRMGENKAFLEVGGKTIIDRTAELFQEIFSQVILVTNDPLPYVYLDLEIVTDLIPISGSLIGIYTGLFYSSNTHCFVAACDMPFLSKKVVEYMIAMKESYDVVIPHLEDGYHPLHALYSKRCLKSIEELINGDNLKIIDFFNKVKVREITPDELIPIDHAMNSFLNINTPEDLETLNNRVKQS